MNLFSAEPRYKSIRYWNHERFNSLKSQETTLVCESMAEKQQEKAPNLEAKGLTEKALLPHCVFHQFKGKGSIIFLKR